MTSTVAATSALAPQLKRHHAVGFGTYILVTEKGRTYIPFCRGSGFLLKYSNLAFYSYHVITAAHVAKPHKFKSLYTQGNNFDGIGDRHMNYKIFPLRGEEGLNEAGHPYLVLHPRVEQFPVCHVVELKIDNEATQLKNYSESHQLDTSLFDELEPVVMDGNPIQEGEPVVLEGVEVSEERYSVSDSGLHFRKRRIEGIVRAGIKSNDFHTLLVVNTEGVQVPASMCGGPVLRASTGHCVGVIAAPIQTAAPPMTIEPPGLHETDKKKFWDPAVDLSDNLPLVNAIGGVGVTGAGFTPIPEFLLQLRRREGV